MLRALRSGVRPMHRRHTHVYLQGPIYASGAKEELAGLPRAMGEGEKSAVVAGPKNRHTGTSFIRPSRYWPVMKWIR